MDYTDLPLFAKLEAPKAEPATIICDDVLAWAEKYDGPPMHALIADPPYHLISDTRNGSPRQLGTGPYGRHTLSTKGFMGKEWDGGNIAFKSETWKALAQHLLPGAFGMCFASSRGWHRLACAIEDAGLIIHPAIFNWRSGEVVEIPGLLGWNFASGFPKASRIDSQIDRAMGVEREVLGTHDTRGDYDGRQRTSQALNRSWRQAEGRSDIRDLSQKIVTAPATPLAQIWGGHRYGLQALKPALEPIIVWQKPYRGKPVESITQTGAGALNIDGGRISTDWSTDPTKRGWQGGNASESWDNGVIGIYRKEPFGKTAGRERKTHPQPGGRWPPNFALCHSHPPDASCEPDACPVAALDQQAGEHTSRPGKTKPSGKSVNCYGFYDSQEDGPKYPGDESHVSRFFHVSDWSLDIAERLAHANPVHYSAKSACRERESGLIGHLPCVSANEPSIIHEGDPRHTTQHYRFDVGLKKVWSPCRRNGHPTVKPALTLCKWLATLLFPPAAYAPRRILCPFSGSGSEGIGAMLAGWEEIVMIDSEPSYVELAQARMAYWQQHRPR